MSVVKGQAEKDKGNAAFKAGDYPTAIGHYSAAVVADPRNATYPLNRAAAYLKLGKNEDAERDCSTVLRLDGKNVKAMFRRGQARVALQKLKEAQDDFQKALTLEPANDAVKQELKKIEPALKTQNKPRSKQPVDVSSLSSASTSSRAAPGEAKPKRRRIPIEIVEPPATTLQSQKNPTTSATATADGEDLMKPVSSRPLEPTSPPSTAAAQSKPTPKTFQEARDVRESARPASRPGGGIFRSNGKHTIFGEKTGAADANASDSSSSPGASSAAPTSVPAPSAPTTVASTTAGGSPPRNYAHANGSAEKAKPPTTLFAFRKRWEKMSTADERWALMDDISPSALPALFQSSLDASLLASLLHTFRETLRADPSPAIRDRVRAFMANLARVPRFSTVVLFMSAEEKALAREVWALVGSGEDEERTWGLS